MIRLELCLLVVAAFAEVGCATHTTTTLVLPGADLGSISKIHVQPGEPGDDEAVAAELERIGVTATVGPTPPQDVRIAASIVRHSTGLDLNAIPESGFVLMLVDRDQERVIALADYYWGNVIGGPSSEELARELVPSLLQRREARVVRRDFNEDGARAEEMIPDSLAPRSRPAAGIVRIGVHGSGLYPQLDPNALREALEATVKRLGIFEIDGGSADYQLDLFITNASVKWIFYDVTVNVEVLWNLSRTDTRATLWQKFVNTSYTANIGDELIGVRRERHATEKTAQKNLEEGVSEFLVMNL